MEVILDRAYPREDYLELLQLSIVYLGGWSGDPPRFSAHGAYHRGEMDGKGYLHPQYCPVFATIAADEVRKTRSPTTGMSRQLHLCQILA